MKRYIVEKIMRNNTDGYYNVIIEGETHLNRTVISSPIQFFTTQGGYNYCHPREDAEQNAKAIAYGLNLLEQMKVSQNKRNPIFEDLYIKEPSIKFAEYLLKKYRESILNPRMIWEIYINDKQM